MFVRLSIALTLLLSATQVSQARGPLGPPALIKADHTMGKYVPPPPRPQVSPAQAAAAEKLLARARSSLSKGDYVKAVDLLSQAKELHPEHPGVLRARARALLTLGYLEWNEDKAIQAQSDARAARALRPGDGALKELNLLTDSLVKRIQRLKRPPNKTAKR